MTFEGKGKLHRVDSLNICTPKILQTCFITFKSQALDHSRLGLENKFLENKSGRIFLRSTGLLYKFLPTNLRVCKPTFYTFYTSHLR